MFDWLKANFFLLIQVYISVTYIFYLMVST